MMSNYAANPTNNSEDLSIRVPIPAAARDQAQAFAAAQPTPEKRDQVFRNTLAVWIVNDYLQWQQYATDLRAGDSWQAGTQLCGDVADLVVTGLGRIECRPVLETDTAFRLPPETWHNRVAYVGVQLDAEFREGRILGFVSALDPEDPPDEISLAELQSVDEWMDYFHRLEVAQKVIMDFFNPLSGDGNESKDPVLARVQQRFADPSAREPLVAQLERIVRDERRNRWRVKGEKIISGWMLSHSAIGETKESAVRETEMSMDRLQGQEIAGALLEALAEVWHDNP